MAKSNLNLEPLPPVREFTVESVYDDLKVMQAKHHEGQHATKVRIDNLIGRFDADKAEAEEKSPKSSKKESAPSDPPATPV